MTDNQGEIIRMTNDLGTDAGSTSINVVAKSLELLFKLMDKIYDAWKNAPDRKAKIYEVKNAKTATERKKAIEKIDSKIGKVNHDLLVKSGKPRTICGIHLTKDEIKDFNAICRRKGIIFSAVSNVQLKKENEKAFLGIECQTADLEKIKDAVEIFNSEKRQRAIDDKIGDILSKGRENLTEQDYNDLRELSGQKEEMQRNFCDKINESTSDQIVNDTFDGKLKPMDIEEAVNRITGRSLDKDQHTIVADAKDPDKYIICHGYNAVDPEGKTYIKTDYEVYQGDELKLKTDDGRFEGRPRHYWEKQRSRIADAADFSGTYYKFINRDEYEKWAACVKEQNAELDIPDKDNINKDYADIRKDLEKQLDKNGMELRDDTLYKKESDVPLWYMELYQQDMIDKLSPNEKITVAESVAIGKQIENCEQIHMVQNELIVAESELLITPQGTKEYEAAVKQREDLQDRLGNLHDTEKELWNTRKGINAAKAELEVSGEREADMAYEHGQEPGRDEKEQKNKVGRKNQDKDKSTMDEVKKDIAGEKSKDSDKSINPVQVLKDKAKEKFTKENR